MTLPSASSLSRASPQRGGEAIDLFRVLAKGTVLVASPSAIARMPVAMRIERAGMAGLLGIEDAAHRGDGLGGGHARRLVEDHPAMNRIAFFLTCSSSSSSSRRRTAARSRCTRGGFEDGFDLLGFGERLVFDKAQIGGEFDGDHVPISPRRNPLCRFSAAMIALGILAAQAVRNRPWHSACRATA